MDRLARTMRHDWRPGPCVIVVETGNRVLVAGVNDDAAEAGIAPGMTLADARTLEPALTTHPSDPRADAKFLSRLARWCTRFTPLIALDGPDSLILNVTGCARLFRGEDNLMHEIAERLPGLGVHARIALADTGGTASALARCGENGAIATPGRTRDALRDLPVEGLRLGGDVCATLKRLGLDRIGDLFPLPSSAIAKRFGRTSYERLARALGAAPEAFDYLTFSPPYVARMGFPEPIGTTEDVAAALDMLTARLCTRLAREGRGCRRLTFSIERVDGTTQTIVAGTSAPVAEPAHLTRLIAEHLDELDAGFGIERTELTMPVTEPRAPATLTLTDGAVSTGLAALLDRLGNRIGFDHVLSFAPADSHIPERAVMAEAAAHAAPSHHVWPDAHRPARLLTHPEPLSGMSETEFLWKGVPHTIARREGPERITAEWWWDDPAWRSGPRDYWCVEDVDGRRFWIYRTRPQAPGLPARWFLHGFFA